MHPEIQSDKPGMCPECGMKLVASEKLKVKSGKSVHPAQDKHEGHMTQMFLKKFWVSLALSVPIILAHFGILKFVGIDYLVLFLGSFVFFSAAGFF